MSDPIKAALKRIKYPANTPCAMGVLTGSVLYFFFAKFDCSLFLLPPYSHKRATTSITISHHLPDSNARGFHPSPSLISTNQRLSAPQSIYYPPLPSRPRWSGFCRVAIMIHLDALPLFIRMSTPSHNNLYMSMVVSMLSQPVH